MSHPVLYDVNTFKQWTFDDHSNVMRAIQEQAALLVLSEIKNYAETTELSIYESEYGPSIFATYLPCTDEEDAFNVSYDFENIYFEPEWMSAKCLLQLRQSLTDMISKIDAHTAGG